MFKAFLLCNREVFKYNSKLENVNPCRKLRGYEYYWGVEKYTTDVKFEIKSDITETSIL